MNINTMVHFYNVQHESSALSEEEKNRTTQKGI